MCSSSLVVPAGCWVNIKYININLLVPSLPGLRAIIFLGNQLTHGKLKPTLSPLLILLSCSEMLRLNLLLSILILLTLSSPDTNLFW